MVSIPVKVPPASPARSTVLIGAAAIKKIRIEFSPAISACIFTGETGSCASGKLCGTVTDYYDSDANPLFELEIGGRQVLVPAVEEFIARIDFEGRTMHLVLPEGLLTLE